MGFSHGKNLFTFLFIFSIFLASSLPQLAAMRPLEGEEWLKKNGVGVVFESLQKGPVTPSGGSPCTYISGGSGKCTLNNMNVAGHVAHPPPAFPDYILAVAAANSVDNADHNQDQSS